MHEKTPPVLPYEQGHVEPGGPARQLTITAHPAIILTKLSVGPLDNNVYFVTEVPSRLTLLIDAAAEPERISALLDGLNLQLSMIITTHQHADHWQGLQALSKRWAVPTLAHADDAEGLPVPPDRVIADGEIISVGRTSLQAWHLAGHTPGGLAFALTAGEQIHLFTGDSLFPGGLGNTSSTAAFQQLFSDVTSKLFDQYPDDAVVHPGHGDDTTLGEQRAHLAEWSTRQW